MKAFCLLPAVVAALSLTSVGFGASAPVSDVAPTAKRRPAVELAQRLATVTPPATLPSDLVFPFNPVAFSQPDPEEQRAFEQAAAANRVASANANATRPGPTGNRELLAAIAAKIPPKGSVFIGKDPSLIINGKFFKVGSKFTVAYSGVDYVLELTAIDRTTFTLRLNGEEITRPIKTAAKTSP